MDTPIQKPRPTEHLLNRDLGDEHMFYDQNGDQVHVLNGTAREIYRLCDGNRSLEDIAESLGLEYEVSVEQALSDVRETVDRLVALKVLAV